MQRRTVCCLVASLLMTPAVCAQEAIRLEGWTYHSDNRYLSDEWADKTGKTLNDGDLTKKAVIYAGGTIVVDVDLGKPGRVTSVVAHVSRPNDNYKLKTFTVQAKVLGHYQDAGAVEGFWGHTEQRRFRLEVKDLNVTTDSLRLVFNTASILCIWEVEIFGQAAAPEGQLKVDLTPASDSKVSSREGDVDNDGKPELILENALVRLIFWPSTGGMCRSFFYKPANCELVAPESAGYGLLRDQLWSPNYEFAGRPYTWRTGGEGKSAWVELSTSGVGGMMSFTTITKRIELTEGSPIVRVHYKLQNDPSSQTEYIYGLWFHHFTGVPGGENRYFDPTEEGVKEYVFDPQKAKGGDEVWYYNPARGWSAVCGHNGAGLAMTMEYKYLNCFYHWSGVGVPEATHEWRFNRLPLKSGEALNTDITLIPFQGLRRVDGVVGDVIGAIAFQPEEGDPTNATVRLQPTSPLSKPAVGVVRLRQLPDGQWRELERVQGLADKPGEAKVTFDNPGVGGYVLNCQVQRDGKLLDDFERPFTKGGARLAYRREPLEKRVGLAAEETVPLPRHDLSDAVVTPHIPWAKPLPGGPIKAVVLCDDMNAREIIELKQRLDLDVTYVKFRTTFWKEELYCGDRSISTPDQAQRRLLDYVKSNRYELFVLAGFNWNAHFSPELQQAITQQIKDGAGLVYIEPDGFRESDELTPMMGLSKGRSFYDVAKWKSAPDSPLTAGLPWDLLPQTRFMDYAKCPEGEVIAKLSNGKPLAATNSLGKGRTVALTYDVLTHDLSYRGYSALTPILSYRGGFLRDEYKQMTWHYYEAWYAWLARLSAWAARRDAGVRLVSLEPLKDVTYGQKAELLLKLEGGRGQYKVSVDFENRWSQLLDHAEATYSAGQGAVPVPVPANLGAGVNLVNVIVRDAGGASVAWGQTYVTCKVPVAIKSLQPERDIVMGARAPRGAQPYDRAFSPQDAFRLKVTLDALAPEARDYKVRARLFDTHRRLLFEDTRPVQPGSPAEMGFEAWPKELRSMGLEWEVTAIGPNGQTDAEYAKLICRWPRDWDRFRLSSWSGIYLWRSEYFYPYLAPLVEDLQDVAFHGITELGTGHVWRHYWHNIDWDFLGLLSYMGKGVPDFVDDKFPEKAAKYNETKDKQYLVRTPCLSNPDWRAKVADHMRARAAEAMKFGGAYGYSMGDEMSLTYYTRYFDYCWSPHCLAWFRTWLQQRYKSLEELNRAWETTFADWEAVVPMTLAESQSKANAAPWCEFRDFMNDVVADFYAMVRQSLQSVDPQAKAGLSGTQEPRAGNGMDWWKNSRGFNYYHAYNTGWSNEMRRSFAAGTGVLQSPYYAGYWQAGRAIEYNMFWCLLHDTSGISAWTTPIFFYNDFTYSESGRDTLALCHEMKRGLWDLLRNARRVHDGIAIHYSHDSINASQLFGREEQIVAIRDAWVKLIEDLGLQYNFVATPQIEAGILTHPKRAEDRYRVLILPESFAISEKEKAEIEAFVKAGGTIIADMNVGVVDGKCRRVGRGSPDPARRVTEGSPGPLRPAVGPSGAVGRPAPNGGMLDDLFGLKRSNKASDGTVGVAVKMRDRQPQDMKVPAAELLSATSATAFGQSVGEQKTPVVFRNTVSKGAAWYLNLDFREFENERTFHSPTETSVRALVEAVLSDAGVKRQFIVEFASGRAPHVEVVRYRAGDLIYLGLLNTSGADEELAKITLPVKWQVYDCRTGEALATRNELRATLVGGQARVYCLAPKPLSAPKLTLTKKDVKPGEAIQYTAALTGGTDSQKQLVRLTVLRPDGSECADYARNLLLGSRAFSGSFQLALNDPQGTWRVIVRDLCSGVKDERRQEVK